MTEDATTIARRAYEAYAEKDRAKLEAVLAEDFHFTSPLDNRLDRATYFARCWPNSEWIEAYDRLDLVPAGARVIASYEGRARGGKRFRNTEILTLRDGRIVEAEVFFGWSLPHPAPPGGFIDGPPR